MTGGSSTLPPVQFSPSVQTPFTVSFTQEEFTEVLSALMTGADLSYPEKSHEVVWHLLKQVEYPTMLLPPAGNDSHIDLWAQLANKPGYTSLYQGTTVQAFGHYYIQQTPAIFQQYVWTANLTPGNWQATVLFFRTTNQGTMRLYWTVPLSGVVNNIGDFNLSGSTLANATLTATFTMTTSALVQIVGISIAPTSPSTGYAMPLTLIRLDKI